MNDCEETTSASNGFSLLLVQPLHSFNLGVLPSPTASSTIVLVLHFLYPPTFKIPFLPFHLHLPQSLQSETTASLSLGPNGESSTSALIRGSAIITPPNIVVYLLKSISEVIRARNETKLIDAREERLIKAIPPMEASTPTAV